MSSPADGDLAGHEELRRALLAALRRGALPHALLLTGEGGSGKRRLAEWLAAARWCAAEPPPCLTCRSCRLVSTGNHPDLHVLVRNPPREQDPDELGSRHEITVDQVRRGLIPALGVRPLEGRGRTVIIDGADELNEAAQNALLKTLEEPPHGTLLLLLAAHADALLDTVRSRCQELRLFPLTAEVLRALFPDADDERLRLAAGRPGRLALRQRLRGGGRAGGGGARRRGRGRRGGRAPAGRRGLPRAPARPPGGRRAGAGGCRGRPARAGDGSAPSHLSRSRLGGGRNRTFGRTDGGPGASCPPHLGYRQASGSALR
jgi:DNA polymerase III delta' subunit